MTAAAPPTTLAPKLWLVLRQGYGWRDLQTDALAGLTVAVVALPLSMALAIASGATPDKGLVTAVVAGAIISLLGGSRVQIGGPTGAFVVIVSGVIAQHGYAGLIAATLMAGVILCLAAVLRLGRLVHRVPEPVIAGFTTEMQAAGRELRRYLYGAGHGFANPSGDHRHPTAVDLAWQRTEAFLTETLRPEPLA